MMPWKRQDNSSIGKLGGVNECRRTRLRSGSRSVCEPQTKSRNNRKEEKLLHNAKEQEHVQRGLDEARLTEWTKWQKHSAADVISAQEAARMVMEGAEEIGTQWVEVDRNEKIRVESEQTGEAKHVPMNLSSLD